MSAREYARLAPKGAGARILTRAEALARTEPPAPGERTGHEWLSELMRPFREYNLWAAKTGGDTREEMDESMPEGRGA